MCLICGHDLISLLMISLPRNPVPPVMNTDLFLKNSWMFDWDSAVLTKAIFRREIQPCRLKNKILKKTRLNDNNDIQVSKKKELTSVRI